MNKDVYITTNDNPYNPHDSFDLWLQYDMMNGYDTCGVLNRTIRESDAFSPQEEAEEIERAIDEIIANDPFDMYKKIVVKY
jgi:hypothetical protein